MIEDYFALVRSSLGGRQLGVTEGWALPVGIFMARKGFDEEVWIDAIPQTVIAIRFSGATVHECGSRFSRSSGRGANVALIGRGEPNRYRANGPISFNQIYIPDEALDSAASFAGMPPLSGRLREDLKFVPDVEFENRVATYCRRAASSADPPTTLEMEGRSLLIFDWLLTLHNRSKKSGPGQNLLTSESRSVDRRLRLALDYLEANLAEDVGMAELVRLTGLSPSYLAEMFRKWTGLPPHRWLVRRRIDRACEFLGDSRRSVTEIAAVLGFASSQHMATVFKKQVGMSPSEYRAMRFG